MRDMTNLTVKELRVRAKELGCVGYSAMKRADLVQLVSDALVAKERDNLKDIYNHSTTPADGQGLCSILAGAALANCAGVLSENELIRIHQLLEECKSLNDMLSNRELMKLINRIPKVFQVRHKHSGIKGLFVVYPLEFIEETKNTQFIVTDGLSKYGNGQWDSTDIEICAYLKKKSEFVKLNVQFINALTNYSDPCFLLPIADYWHDQMMRTLTDDFAKLKFHNIVCSFGEESTENDLKLATMLKTSITLKNERYAVQLEREQYIKSYRDLKCGRLPVEGRYSYMITDPAFMLNQLYGSNITDELKAGEYWMNGKTCKAGLFRSPLIAPFEAQRVQLVSHEFYDVFYRDMTIFNGYDGIWELMGGADFDGDTCACIPEDTEYGKIIVDAIADCPYYILHEGKTAQKSLYTRDSFWHDLAKYNSIVAKADRTGLITNYATKAIELWHSFKNYMFYAKKNGCEGLYLAHPNTFPKDENGNVLDTNPFIRVINGKKLFVVRGLVKATKETNYKWVEEYPCGEYSFEQIEELMNKLMLKVEYLNPVQGDEIDGAKTGFYPELFDAIQVAYQSVQTTKRNELVGKTITKTALRNSYVSYSPLGIIFKHVEELEKEFFEALDAKSNDKTGLLKNLLTAEETKKLGMNIKINDQIVSLIDYLKQRKSNYGKAMFAIRSDKGLSEEEKIREMIALRDGSDILQNGTTVHHKGEKEILVDIAKSLDISDELMAVACYIASNEKDNNQSQSLSYGWILFNELIAVFARNNDSVNLYRVPSYTEDVAICKGKLLVNGKPVGSVDAEDCAFVPVQNINGRLYALVKKTAQQKKAVTTLSSQQYDCGMLAGFKYNGQSVETFKSATRTHNYQFDVDYDADNNICAFVDGQLFCRLSSIDAGSRNINELVGHKVQIVASPNYEETQATMKHLVVTVVC